MNHRYQMHSGHHSALALNGSVANGPERQNSMYAFNDRVECDPRWPTRATTGGLAGAGELSTMGAAPGWPTACAQGQGIHGFPGRVFRWLAVESSAKVTDQLACGRKR